MNLFVLKGEETHKIPVDDTTILADWLTDNGFSIDDDILAVPVRELSPGQELFNVDNLKADELNPYIPHVNEFIISLGSQLEKIGLISKGKQSVMEFINEIDSKVLGGKYIINDIYDSLINPDQAPAHMDRPRKRIGQDEISRWHVLVNQKISADNSLTNSKKEVTIQEVGEVFEEIYKMFGYTRYNTYYRTAYLTLEEFAMYLTELNVIDYPSLRNLAPVMGYSVSGSYLIDDLQKPYRNSPNHPDIIQERFIDKPKPFLENHYKSEGLSGTALTQKVQEVLDKISSIIKPYKDQAKSAYGAEGVLLKNVPENSIKYKLFSGIIHSGPSLSGSKILENEMSKEEFSKLFFGSKYAFGEATVKYIDSPLQLGTVLRMKFAVSHWQTSDFHGLSTPITMSEYDLQKLKTSINSYIDKWILSNPYKDKVYSASALKKVKYYVAENFVKHGNQYSQNDLLPDIKLTNDLYFAAMERLYLEFKKNNPGKSITETSRNVFSPSYEKIEKELKTGRHIFTVLNPKYGPKFFSQEVLQDLLQTLTKWHINHFEGQKKKFEFGTRKTGLIYDRNDPEIQRVLYYYQNAINSIHDYARERNIDLQSTTPSAISLIDRLDSKKELVMNEYQIKKWEADETKAYHNIYHLCKYLGFDPMTFTPLDDKIFKTGSYQRHHFLALAFRKMSSHVDDIVLTSDTLHHSKYENFLKDEGLAAEVYVKLLMQSLAELINMKDQNGNYLKIKEDHMREVLYKNFGEIEGEKILEKWMKGKHQLDFAKTLREFNNRRQDAFKGKYEQFLINKYGNAYSAYFKEVRKITYTKILATQSNLDFLSEIYGRIFTLRPAQVNLDDYN